MSNATSDDDDTSLGSNPSPRPPHRDYVVAESKKCEDDDDEEKEDENDNNIIEVCKRARAFGLRCSFYIWPSLDDRDDRAARISSLLRQLLHLDIITPSTDVLRVVQILSGNGSTAIAKKSAVGSCYTALNHISKLEPQASVSNHMFHELSAQIGRLTVKRHRGHFVLQAIRLGQMSLVPRLDGKGRTINVDMVVLTRLSDGTLKEYIIDGEKPAVYVTYHNNVSSTVDFAVDDQCGGGTALVYKYDVDFDETVIALTETFGLYHSYMELSIAVRQHYEQLNMFKSRRPAHYNWMSKTVLDQRLDALLQIPRNRMLLIVRGDDAMVDFETLREQLQSRAALDRIDVLVWDSAVCNFHSLWNFIDGTDRGNAAQLLHHVRGATQEPAIASFLFRHTFTDELQMIHNRVFLHEEKLVDHLIKAFKFTHAVVCSHDGSTTDNLPWSFVKLGSSNCFTVCLDDNFHQTNTGTANVDIVTLD